MNEFLNQITDVVAPYIPRIFSALLILIVGWIVALLLGAIVRGALKRTTLDNRLAAWLAGEKAQNDGYRGLGREVCLLPGHVVRTGVGFSDPGVDDRY